MIKLAGVFVEYTLLMENDLHNKDRWPSDESSPNAPLIMKVTKSAKINPTKYPKPFSSPLMMDPSAKKHTNMKGARRKNK